MTTHWFGNCCAVAILVSQWASAQSWFSLNDEGSRLREQGRCRQAVSVLLRARSAAIEEPDTRQSALAISTNNLARAYLCQKQFTQAERHFRDALALVEGDLSAEMKAAILNNLGILMMNLSRTKEAEELLKRSLAVSETLHRADDTTTASAMTSLGVLRLESGEYAQARDLFRRSILIWEVAGPNRIEAATALNNLGAVSLYLREYEDAKHLIARAIDLRRRLLPPNHPDIAQSLYNYGVALEKLGQRKAAGAAFRQAASMRAIYASENLTGATVDVKVLGR